jgi:arylformamidase
MSDKQLIDISISLDDSIPCWPDSPGFRINRTKTIDNGDGCNNSFISMDVHIGTHIDAPWHFISGGKTVDELDIHKLVGPVYVVHFAGVSEVNRNMLENISIPDGISRLLLKTDNSEQWNRPEKKFQKDFIAITANAAEWLVENHFDLVGIDYLSIQKFNDSSLTHEILLNAEIIIVEGLNLAHVQQGIYELYCLPLKLAGADGAPARVMLREL